MRGKKIEGRGVSWTLLTRTAAAVSLAVAVMMSVGAPAVTAQTAAGGGASAAVVDTTRNARAPDTATQSLSATAAAAATATTADTVKIDTISPPSTAAAIDTAKIDTARIDTAAAVASADTVSAAPPPADTLTALTADTAAAMSTVTPAAADAADTETAQELPASKPPRGGLIGFLIGNIAYVLFFCVSIAVIIITAVFFMNKRDSRRFLTTTRLSVLDKMVQKACRYIETNYTNPDLSVGVVCRELVTGEAYLDTLFVKEIGVDVHDFIAQVRVNRIKNLLAENPAADAETIWKQCGFADKVSADRCFAKLCGGVGMEVYAKSLMSAGKTPEA